MTGERCYRTVVKRLKLYVICALPVCPGLDRDELEVLGPSDSAGLPWPNGLGS